MRVSDPSLDALEFAALKAVAASLAVTDLGHRELASVRPFSDPGELRRSLAMTAEVESLLADGRLISGFEEKLAPLAERLAREHSEVDGNDLLLLARALAVSQAALDRIRAEGGERPALADRFAGVADLSELCNAIGARLDERGRVRDDASPRLRRLSQKSRKARRDLYSRLGDFVGGHRDNLAEDTVSVQDGRLVLMLRAGSKGRLPGIVQGRSASGKSFYFEPLDFVDDNNELQGYQREEEAERQRIMAELLARAQGHAGDIREHWRLLAELDARQALCGLKARLEGHFIEPREEEELELQDARHPLLDPALAEDRERALGRAGHTKPVVPLTLSLDRERRMLVITGPNAGGKTVALKTVGLLALACHCGFPLPVAIHSRMPFLASLVAVVGDDQNLLEERSTFSGRLLRLREVWQEAHGSSLLLVDELGSGTDPAEGAALGTALVEALAARKPWTVVTTHLTAIAATALELDGATCGAMEFDSTTGSPTYRLVPGAPGGSEALALARRLELPAEWVDRADELLGPDERRLRSLLREVEDSKLRLEEERQRLAGLLEQADEDRRRAAEHLEAANNERLEVAKRLKRELRDFRQKVKRELVEETERLAGEVKAGRKRSAVESTVERLFEAAPALDAQDPDGSEVEVGDTVEHEGLGWRGELLELDGGRATVTVHGKRVRCRPEELVRAEPEPKPTSGRAAGSWRAGRSSSQSAEVAELMLVGVRVEPALERLESFLDRALLGSSEQVRVVHGHGSGRLRAAVRKQLKGHPAVSSWRPGDDSEGGDGATVVNLAG